LTSRLHVEAATGLALITQSWSWYFDAWPPGHAVELPLRPVESVAAVRLYDETGAATMLDPANWFLDGAGLHPRLVRPGPLPLPPVERVAAVRLYDETGAASMLDPANWFLDGAGLHPRLVRHGALPWPAPGRVANGIEIALTAGYGPAASDVPAPIRQALLI